MAYQIPTMQQESRRFSGFRKAIAVNGSRLWDRHLAMSRIGATGRGGINRQALTPEDTRARVLLLSWAAARGYSASIDAIGNLFIRRAGECSDLPPVVTGSHLDSQPTGGNFDGVYGVLAGLEVLESLDDAGVTTHRPIELVVWMNEEGARFPPATMGSAVLAGALPLEKALATTDKHGMSVGEALAAQRHLLPSLSGRGLAEPAFAYLEAHIEQGPILENRGCQIGVVTGIQGLQMLDIEVRGDEAHAGTTPMQSRRDALMTAMDLIEELRTIAHDPTDTLRFTIGRFEVSPGSPNTVPGRAYFTIDLRHPDIDVLTRVGNCLIDASKQQNGPCAVTARVLLDSHPVVFDAEIVGIVRNAAREAGFAHTDLISGATHDAKFMACRCPTGMIFVPCLGGLSHNEAESARAEDLAAGAQVLGAAICTVAAKM